MYYYSETELGVKARFFLARESLKHDIIAIGPFRQNRTD